MFETTSKGMVYALNNFTMVDKKSGEEKGLIDIFYIHENPNETTSKVGWVSGHTFVNFNDEIYKGLKSILLKSCDLNFKLVADYNDNTRFSSKLFKINDLVIKQ